jgi:hypothetical protein
VRTQDTTMPARTKGIGSSAISWRSPKILARRKRRAPRSARATTTRRLQVPARTRCCTHTSRESAACRQAPNRAVVGLTHESASAPPLGHTSSRRGLARDGQRHRARGAGSRLNDGVREVPLQW